MQALFALDNYRGAGNPACSRLDPLESGSAAWIGCPTFPEPRLSEIITDTTLAGNHSRPRGHPVVAPIRAPSVSERVCCRGRRQATNHMYGHILLAHRELVPAGGARPIVRAADRVVAVGSSRRDGQVDLVEPGADHTSEGDGRRIAPDAAHRERLEHPGLA